jgi:hypothetical protein
LVGPEFQENMEIISFGMGKCVYMYISVFWVFRVSIGVVVVMGVSRSKVSLMESAQTP